MDLKVVKDDQLAEDFTRFVESATNRGSITWRRKADMMVASLNPILDIDLILSEADTDDDEILWQCPNTACPSKN